MKITHYLYNAFLVEEDGQKIAIDPGQNLGIFQLKSLIPESNLDPVTFDWRYIPSSDLGGDTFGFHRVDDRHVALYLVDVTGHGLDSALLFPTLGVGMQEALRHDIEALHATFTAFNRSFREAKEVLDDLGV